MEIQSNNQTLDDAIRVYLGGDYEVGAIQVGLQRERLVERFGKLAVTLEPQIEGVLNSALKKFRARNDSESKTLLSVIADSNPDLSHVTCLKIESHSIFQIEH